MVWKHAASLSEQTRQDVRGDLFTLCLRGCSDLIDSSVVDFIKASSRAVVVGRVWSGPPLIFPKKNKGKKGQIVLELHWHSPRVFSVFFGRASKSVQLSVTQKLPHNYKTHQKASYQRLTPILPPCFYQFIYLFLNKMCFFKHPPFFFFFLNGVLWKPSRGRALWELHYLSRPGMTQVQPECFQVLSDWCRRDACNIRHLPEVCHIMWA